jgi:hypothetical protein
MSFKLDARARKTEDANHTKVEPNHKETWLEEASWSKDWPGGPVLNTTSRKKSIYSIDLLYAWLSPDQLKLRD